MDKEMETMIFKNAVCKFGIDDQVSMAKGEMGECIAALTQYFTQGKVEPEAVIDEIVDVQIMMGQMEWFMDNVAGQGATKKRYIEKMERLVNLIGFESQHIDRSFDFSELKTNGPKPGDECEAYHQDIGWIPVRLLRKRNNGAFDVWAVEKLDTHELFWAKELRYDIKQEDIIRIVEVDVCISKNKTPEEELKDKIVDKYPNAISLFDFMEKYKTLDAGSLLVNHPSVPAVKVTSEMLDNGQILNWHFMQCWFVVDAPQWEEVKAKQDNKDAKELYSLVVGCDVNNPPWGLMKNSVKNLFIGLAELGIKPTRKELSKETELNLLFSAVGVRARDGGREIANRLYELGYRAPEGGSVKV